SLTRDGLARLSLRPLSPRVATQLPAPRRSAPASMHASHAPRSRPHALASQRWAPPLRFCFFFQAEDGIRDATVTGVQTCALPIHGRVCRDEAGARRCFAGAGRTGTGGSREEDRGAGGQGSAPHYVCAV